MHKPHDTLFQITMNQPGSAEALIRRCAAFEGYEDLASVLPGASVVWIPGSFVDRNGDKLYSDRLYRIDSPDGDPVFVYVLFEHKSYSDSSIAIQLLLCMTEIWARECGDGNLIPILPIVVYHGGEPWTQPLSFGGFYTGGSTLSPGALDFRYALADFSDRDWKRFPTHAALRTGLMALVAGSSDVDLDQVPMEPLTGETPIAEDFAMAIYAYLRHVRKDLREDHGMNALMERLLQGHGKDLMSDLVSDLKDEGKVEGLATAVLRLVSKRGWALSDAQKTRIQTASEADLLRWIDETGEVASLEVLFGPTDA